MPNSLINEERVLYAFRNKETNVFVITGTYNISENEIQQIEEFLDSIKKAKKIE